MAKKETVTKIVTTKKESKDKNTAPLLKQETKRGIYAILAYVVALVFILSAFNSAGVAGNFLYKVFSYLFGVGYALLPIFAMLLGYTYMKEESPTLALAHRIAGGVFFLTGLSLIDIVSMRTVGEHKGGILGEVFTWPFTSLFDTYASLLILGALFIISLFVLFDERPKFLPYIERFRVWLMNKLARKKKEETYEEYEPVPIPEPEEEEIKPVTKKEKKIEEEEVFIPSKPRKSNSDYTPPPLELLERDKGKPNVGDIKANANIIKRTLQNFGILVEMDEITIGPSVTRYALKPAEGVKLSRIVGLQSDLALALAAHPIRIEAPIPGKSLVGIEIPNKVKSTVGLATLLSDPAFHSPNPLMVALGRGISGKAHFGNLAKMPHALIAGTTGSGKSVTIHSIITSLLYRNGPEELRFIMVDPKRVELTLYNKIPHLLTPVITDSKKAILALKWAAKEMDRRYDILQSESARDITSYHALIQNDTKNKEGEDRDKMPYIVVIIDELADIMQAYPRELEAAIVRLAQMSRAVGIHLILSTQRPEVNVITGLIKANVPARIALKVASQIDSRTILDQGGAEKLLGQGDMLCLAGESQPERLQSAFISEGEVKKVVSFLADAYKDEVPDEIINLSGNISADKSIFESSLEDGDSDDEMYEAAREIVIETGKASTSFLQRKLKLGYARAARLMDILEERGVVGPSDGARGREVLERSPDAVMKEEFGVTEEDK